MSSFVGGVRSNRTTQTTQLHFPGASAVNKLLINSHQALARSMRSDSKYSTDTFHRPPVDPTPIILLLRLPRHIPIIPFPFHTSTHTSQLRPPPRLTQPTRHAIIRLLRPRQPCTIRPPLP
jgi:hypothetical protein